jgi:hypothetical protein
MSKANNNLTKSRLRKIKSLTLEDSQLVRQRLSFCKFPFSEYIYIYFFLKRQNRMPSGRFQYVILNSIAHKWMDFHVLDFSTQIIR